MKLSLTIINKIGFDFSQKKLLKTLNGLFLKFAPKNIEQAQLELIFTDDREIKQLNNKYRGKNQVTDVLSFPLTFSTRNDTLIPFFNNLHLGTIVISLEQAKRQIGKFGNDDLESEIIGLAEHGFRHLLGYDHNKIGQWQKKKVEVEE